MPLSEKLIHLQQPPLAYLCLQTPSINFSFSLNAYWTLWDLSHCPTHLGGPRHSALAPLPRPSEGLILLLFEGPFHINRPPLPLHAFNHLPYPFPFTLDGYWTLVRPLTLKGASPVVAHPLFSLPHTSPERQLLPLSEGLFRLH